MKAWVLQDIGMISYEDVAMPEPGEAEVLVRVKVAGICGSDIPRIFRDGAHKMPLIPGHEFTGEVVELGKWSDKRWLNKRVGICPLIPCHLCTVCRKGQHEMCRQYSYLGSRRDGGFAEYVAVPQNNLITLPENVTYEQAAMLEPMAVAIHAMGRAAIMQEDTVVVCGLGAVGMFLLMFLLSRGIKNILAIGNKDCQCEKAVKSGLPAERFCDSRRESVEEWLKLHTDNDGADVFFECVGRNETILQALNLTAPGGTVCMVGNPCTDMTFDKQSYWKILRGQLHIVGTWNSSFFTGYRDSEEESTDWQCVLSCLNKGSIAPQNIITHRFPIEHLDKGLRMMRDKLEEYIKVMVVMDKG